MRSLLAVLAALAIVGAACGGDELTIGDVETVTVNELDNAVQEAASALLTRVSVPIAVIYFSAADPEQVIRYDWIDFRRGGEALAVYRYLEEDRTEALFLQSGQWMTALSGDEGSQLWEPDNSTASAFERLPAVALMARTSAEDNAGIAPQVATSQTASDGSQLWALETGDDLTQEWIISPSGLLNFYRVFSEAGLDSGAGTIVYEFGISEEEPDPIIVPAAGSPLVLDDLDLPPALRSLD